jgi:ribonucleoside-diphosphate reductase alpha chain
MQAPYTEVEESAYLELLAQMPNVDWGVLQQYEKQDTTTSAKELACVAGYCEI